jgi:predicted N-acetyltransferase YhbS
MSTPLCRRDYAVDPGLCDPVFELLETWFVGIGVRRTAALQLGSDWRNCSTPFVCERGGRVISHVGLLEMSYVVGGERLQFGGVHAVITLESERRRGHFRRIMEELLDYCDGRFAALELGTENPEYYEPFGFRVVPEYRFAAPVRSTGGTAGFRAIDPGSIQDVALLDRLLTDRTPVSNRLGVVDERDVFKFTQGVEDVFYSAALDCLAAFEIEGRRMLLSDVVANELPSIDAILHELEQPIDEVVFHFSPDRFDVDAHPEAYRHDGDVYMVRGPLGIETEPFMVPPPARH